MAEEASSSGRRSFLVALSALGSAFVGAVLAWPAVGYVFDPLRKAAGGKKGRWLGVADLDALDKEHPVSLPVIGEQRDAWTRSPEVRLGTVWVRRGEGEQVHAWNAECPHLGCKVGYDKRDKQFGCPCHESAFAPDGAVLGGPSPRSLDPLETRVRDGRVEVRFVRFRAQVRERIEIG